MKKFKIKKIFLIIIILIILPLKVNAKENLVNIYLFHSNTCSHCKSEIKLLNDLEKKYPNIKIYKYEISNESNQELFNNVLALYNLKTTGVPLTIIGDKVLTGYSEEHSKLTFIKTIEYYSKYGYKDKVADIVNNQNLPTFKIEENQISINKFLKEYGNYQIIGSIKTNDLDLNSITILTSVLSELNIFNLLILIIISYIILKTKISKEKIISSLIYILSYIISNTIIILNIKFISILTTIMYIIILIYLIIKYKSTKKKCNIIWSTIILLSIVSNILKDNFYNKYISIFRNIIDLNNLSIFDTIIEYLTNLSIVFIISITSIIALNYLMNKIYRRSNL